MFGKETELSCFTAPGPQFVPQPDKTAFVNKTRMRVTAASRNFQHEKEDEEEQQQQQQQERRSTESILSRDGTKTKVIHDYRYGIHVDCDLWPIL